MKVTHLVPAIQARLGAVKVVVHDRLEFMDLTVRAYTSETEGIQVDVPRSVVERADRWEGLAENIVSRFVAAGWKTTYDADWIPRVDDAELEEEIESPEQKKMREEWSLEEETVEQRGDVSGEAEVYF